jgi:type III pantothenate kinase
MSVLLVADVGKTNTKIGVFDGPALVASWRLTSRLEQTADEYGVFIETLWRTRGLERHAIDAIAISNVVPQVQQILEWMCEQYFRIEPYFVQPGVNTPMPLVVDNPTGVDGDLRRAVDRRGFRHGDDLRLRHSRASSTATPASSRG